MESWKRNISLWLNFDGIVLNISQSSVLTLSVWGKANWFPRDRNVGESLVNPLSLSLSLSFSLFNSVNRSGYFRVRNRVYSIMERRPGRRIYWLGVEFDAISVKFDGASSIIPAINSNKWIRYFVARPDETASVRRFLGGEDATSVCKSFQR